MYLMVPVLFYASERILTAIDERNHRVNIIKVRIFHSFIAILSIWKVRSLLLNKMMRCGNFITLQAIIYTGNVLALYMSKPPGFKYKSGMYMFVKCPDISNFEW